MNGVIITTMEIIGTVAFAISGALVAISCGLDVFGVIFVGIITSVGGGMVRDILIGNYPPMIFSNEYILVVASLTALIVFVISHINRHHFKTFKGKIERINNIFDAIGLSAFSVMGTEMACAAGYADKAVFVVFMGMLTGVGGGIFRDVLVSKTPYVLKKHVYAVASIAGSSVYYFISVTFAEKFTATIVAMMLIILIRLLATKYHWKLPKINSDN